MNEDNLVNIGTSGASTVGNVISTWLTNRANERLADKANQWALEQWQRENDYNLPVHQLERLRQAGINPNLAYANGSPMNEAAGSPAVTSAAGTQVAPQVDPYLMSQVALANSQARKNNADAQGKELENVNYPEYLESVKADVELKRAKAKESVQNVSKMAQEISESKDRSKLIQKQAERLDQDVQLMQQTWNAQVEKILAEKQISAAEALRVGEKLDAQIQQMKAAAYSAQMSGDLSREQKMLVAHQIDVLDEQAAYFHEQHKYLSTVNGYIPQDQARKWIEATTGAVTSTLGAVADCVGAFKGSPAPMQQYSVPTSVSY